MLKYKHIQAEINSKPPMGVKIPIPPKPILLVLCNNESAYNEPLKKTMPIENNWVAYFIYLLGKCNESRPVNAKPME